MALQETPLRSPRPQQATHEKLCCKDPGVLHSQEFQSSKDSGQLTQHWLLGSLYGKNSAVLKRDEPETAKLYRNPRNH